VEPAQPQRVPLKLPGPVLPAPSTIPSSTWRSRSRSSSPSKRGPILKREDLQHLDPPIHVIGSRRKARGECGVELPATVAELWEHCEVCRSLYAARFMSVANVLRSNVPSPLSPAIPSSPPPTNVIGRPSSAPWIWQRSRQRNAGNARRQNASGLPRSASRS
jgi:hypothetical protein